MALDGLVIRALVSEMQSLVGGRIHKIYQPFARDLIVHVRTRGKTSKLLLSANPTYPRMHFTEASYENPQEPPMFCMIMRKYCESGIVESIEQVGMERIVHIHIRHRNELGDLGVKTVVIEMMGRHSNIMLIDPETKQILDGIHHVTSAINSHRSVLPGVPYIAPPDQGKLNPFEVDLHEWTRSASELELPQQIVQTFSGISPLNAKEIAARGKEQFPRIMSDLQNDRYEPNIVQTDDDKTYFSVLPLRHLHGNIKTFSTIHECLERYYSDKTMKDLVKERVGNLYRWVQNEKTKNEKKLKKLQKTLAAAEDSDHLRVTGELLTASLHLVNRGDKEVTVPNYYDENEASVRITLDPRLSPADNAQRYFKRYTKSKNSIEIVQQQIAETEAEINYLESLQQQLEHAELSDVDEIREELSEQGYMRQRQARSRAKKKQSKPQLHEYTSSEGIPIYVGKNNLQNEYLTNRFARPDETWLHTKDIPGSHVVIKANEFGEATLEEAAMLAAYYSKARESSQVPVDYTLIRHVRKPNGAKPGFVIYDNQKTLFITPDEQRIAKLS